MCSQNLKHGVRVLSCGWAARWTLCGGVLSLATLPVCLSKTKSRRCDRWTNRHLHETSPADDPLWNNYFCLCNFFRCFMFWLWKRVVVWLKMHLSAHISRTEIFKLPNFWRDISFYSHVNHETHFLHTGWFLKQLLRLSSAESFKSWGSPVVIWKLKTQTSFFFSFSHNLLSSSTCSRVIKQKMNTDTKKDRTDETLEIN